MADRLRVEAVLETEGAGAWVSAPQYGTELPDPERATYLLTRTATGAFGMAIRGYSQGDPLVGVVAADKTLGVTVGDKAYDAIGFFDNVMAVDTDDDRERYAAHMQLPEEQRSRLLLHVLEQSQEGAWNLLQPAEYNDYDSAGRLVFISPELVTLASGKFGEPDGVSSYAGFGGYKLNPPKSAKVVEDGPLFNIVPHDSSARGMVVSAIHERISSLPTMVTSAGELTPAMVETAESLVPPADSAA